MTLKDWRDLALHVLLGALFTFVSLRVGTVTWLAVGWPSLFGFERERARQSEISKWTPHRWREAIAWVVGAALGWALS